MAWSNNDIKKNLGKSIIIEPYSEESCTGYGYDISIADIVGIHEKCTKKDGSVHIPAKTSFCIISQEYFRLGNKVYANIYARLSATAFGIKLNSTAIEPGFANRLLIYGRNPTSVRVSFPLKSIATVVFHSLESSSSKEKTPSNDTRTFLEEHIGESIKQEVHDEIIAKFNQNDEDKINELNESFNVHNNKLFFFRRLMYIRDALISNKQLKEWLSKWKKIIIWATGITGILATLLLNFDIIMSVVKDLI